MPAVGAIERFTEAVRLAGLEPEIQRYPEGTRTARDAAAAVGCDVAQIVKSLVFDSEIGPVLILTSGSNRVDEQLAANALGVAELGKADARVVREVTGFAIGGTPPLGHDTALPTLIDRDLLDHDTVWAAAGTPDSCFPIAPARLVDLSGGEVADVAG